MRLFVPLTRDEMEALASLAREERRRPQDQGAALIARALRERQDLPLSRPRNNAHRDAATSVTTQAPRCCRAQSQEVSEGSQ